MTSSSSSPATSGNTWWQGTHGNSDDDGHNVTNKSVPHLSLLQLNLYQSLLVSGGLRARDGGFADGFTNGLGLKLRTRRLSVPILVPFSFQPVRLNFNIPLKMYYKSNSFYRKMHKYSKTYAHIFQFADKKQINLASLRLEPVISCFRNLGESPCCHYH